MTALSSYTPFLIGQGKSETGYFTYLDSWIKPEDAFDQLSGAYVYRGSLYQRNGMILFPSTPQAGALVYLNNEIDANGDGAGTQKAFSFTLQNFPLLSSATYTVTITMIIGGVYSTATATTPGANNISGANIDGTHPHTLDYTAGTVVFTTITAPDANTPITVQYTYVPTNLKSNAGIGINNPIMGIKTFINETTDEQVLVVLDTRRANYWNSSTMQFTPIQSIQQTIFTFPGGTNNTGVINTQWLNLAPFTLSVVIYQSDGVTVYDSSTDIPQTSTLGHWAAGINGHIDTTASVIGYSVGTVEVHFGGNVPKGYIAILTASLQGDYFTGDNTNFFNSTNWRPSDAYQAELYLTNNHDFITLFNGSTLSRPPLGTTLAHVTNYINDIQTALDVMVYQERLLLIRPTLVNHSNPEAQWIYWGQAENPQVFNPWNFAADVKGNGGQIAASTGDWIQSAEFLRDAIVVFFTNSTWLFRYTGNEFDPFRFVKISSARNTNAPYGSVSYDTRATAMGSKGLIYCDGTNVDRYDEEVIDLWEDINQNAFAQCFAQKFDSINQTWMLYPSMEGDSSTSDSVIVFNFLENTWATFVPNMGTLAQNTTLSNTLSCLGIGFTTDDTTWADFGPNGTYPNYTWSQTDWAWNADFDQNLSPRLLAGDQNGYVYEVNTGSTDNAGPTQTNPIITQVTTKLYNPYAPTGEKARFGYLDVYYEINAPVQIVFNFYLNGSVNVAQSNTLTLDSPTEGIQNGWKRIYLNMVGQFIQWEITSLLGYTDTDPPIPIYNTAGTFKILGQILYALPAGRLTPGTFT